MMGKDLEPLAVKAEGFTMVKEKGGKWGFIATKAGSILVGPTTDPSLNLGLEHTLSLIR